MLKKLVNDARFKMTITSVGPLLIKSGHPTLIGPDMTPVLTFRHGESQVYLPGSSLKGVFRSHVEKVIRSIRDDVVVCDPILTKKKAQETGRAIAEVSCSDVFTRYEHEPNTILPTEVVYEKSCPACRLFGSTHFIGRVSIGDAYLVDETDPRPTETRDGVGIDRLTGGAADKAKFDLEVVADGTAFQCHVVLRNFECWQLGALFLVLQDINDGLIFIGSGKSRGLGAVKAEVSEITITHIGRPEDRPSTDIWGLGKFLEGQNPNYGTMPDDFLKIESAPPSVARGVRHIQAFSNSALATVQEKAIDHFLNRMKMYPEHQTEVSNG